METQQTKPAQTGREKFFNARAESYRKQRDKFADQIAALRSQFPGGNVTHPAAIASIADLERRKKSAHNEMMRALNNAGRR
jgi:hypothetical protein